MWKDHYSSILTVNSFLRDQPVMYFLQATLGKVRGYMNLVIWIILDIFFLIWCKQYMSILRQKGPIYERVKLEKKGTLVI